MTIKNITKTYTIEGGEAVHTGYFIVTDNLPLKHATKWVWDSITKQPAFKHSPEKLITRLENAQ